METENQDIQLHMWGNDDTLYLKFGPGYKFILFLVEYCVYVYINELVSSTDEVDV